MVLLLMTGAHQQPVLIFISHTVIIIFISTISVFVYSKKYGSIRNNRKIYDTLCRSLPIPTADS